MSSAGAGLILGWGVGRLCGGSEEQRPSRPSLPPQVIYMARNPKDLVVSYYQFHRSLRTMSYRGTFQEFCRRFMNDKRKCVVRCHQWLPRCPCMRVPCARCPRSPR